VNANLVRLILRHADERPEATALVVPVAWSSTAVTEERRVTFGELGDRIRRTSGALRAEGFTAGDRVVVMFPVGLDLYCLILGLFHAGMAAVLIDTGMGPKKVLDAVRRSGAAGIVSVHALLKHRWWVPTLWGLRKYGVDASGIALAPAARLHDGEPADLATVGADDHALITFTSGSTGRPKGADRTHGLLVAQHEALAEHFPVEPGEIDMPCFPVVTLHNLCLGIPTVVPPVDFRDVAAAPAESVWAFAAEHGVTRMSGAPAYLSRLLIALEDRRSAPPSTLRSVGVGGARVAVSLCRRTLEALPGVEAKVLYGSTEAEPISSVDFADVLAFEGEGALVGEVAAAATVELVSLPEEPPDLDGRGVASYVVPTGEPGELVVSGPHVNRGYLDDPDANRANKLYEPDGAVWHRTGDMARWDGDRLVLVGRTRDMLRVHGRVVAPFPVEAALEEVPGVIRAGVVQTDDGTTIAFVSVEQPSAVDGARAVLAARGLEAFVEVHESMPVDSRHRSRIARSVLRSYAEHLVNK